MNDVNCSESDSRARRMYAGCAAAAVILSGFLFLACAGEPPRRPNVMHPVHERRAVEIIARTFRDADIEPERNRVIMVGDSKGKPLRLDIAAAEHKWGIAYVTAEDQKELGDAIPRHDSESDALVIVDGAGKDERALLLYERDYLSDDLEGEAHSSTQIAAEKKIERDARDFVLKAQHEKWP